MLDLSILLLISMNIFSSHLEQEKTKKLLAEDFDFTKLIEPIAADTFFETYWENYPLILKRDKLDFYSDLFTINDLDSLFYFSGIQFPDLRLLNKSNLLPQSYECKEQLTTIKILKKAYQEGNTVVLNNLQNRQETILNFSRNLECFLNHSANINLYLTPKNSQGFLPHFDTHEVFILQIDGTKLWRIYDSPLSLPLPISTDKQPRFVPRKGELGDILNEVVLSPGDLLYIPRGYVHAAETTENASLHLTLGINTLTWSDMVSHALQLVAQHEVELRKSLPVGFLNKETISDSFKKQFKESMKILLNEAVLEEVIDSLK